jgi:hypothetical protein
MSLNETVVKSTQEKLNKDEKEASMYYNDTLNLGSVNLYEILGVPEIDGITDDFQRKVSDGYFVKTALTASDEEKKYISLASIILSNPILKAQYDFSTFTYDIKNYKKSA